VQLGLLKLVELRLRELRPLELMRLPRLAARQLLLEIELQKQLELLPLVALRLRKLESLEFEPALALEAPLFLWLLVELPG
jgi:hypothetical protein